MLGGLNIQRRGGIHTLLSAGGIPLCLFFAAGLLDGTQSYLLLFVLALVPSTHYNSRVEEF